ncbi:MAG: calcium/sodium antiporter [Pyrinomonadaceae bacterium]
MLLAAFAVLFGLVLLVWSADKFVDGAAAFAKNMGMPSLLIGMVIVGFGTSVPEMIVSAFSALQGNPGIALGNAYGSNITNIALILGITALLNPIIVDSQILRKELPILAVISIFAGFQAWDNQITRFEAILLLIVFAGIMGWTIFEGLRKRNDELGEEMEAELAAVKMSNPKAIMLIVIGIVLLMISSKVLVWGAVEIAHHFGVGDLVVGLTVVALGTSLPELASSVAAARKGEDEIALGNVLGSNLFNTLAVVGIAGTIHPMSFGPEVFGRDIPVMTLLTFSLFLAGFGLVRKGTIDRIGGLIFLVCWILYTAILLYGALS